MAIKFVNVEPESEGKPKRSNRADAPLPEREPDVDALKESVDPELPHAKPAPKKRGRKSALLQALSRGDSTPGLVRFLALLQDPGVRNVDDVELVLWRERRWRTR